MRKQRIYLKPVEWDVHVFYEMVPDCADEVLALMRDLGASDVVLHRAEDNLCSGEMNSGMTYTSPDECSTVMVLSRTTSADEFMNTFDHEKGHAVKHICSARGIDPFSEEAEYLAGDLGMQMFRVARGYMCERCRERVGI